MQKWVRRHAAGQGPFFNLRKSLTGFRNLKISKNSSDRFNLLSFLHFISVKLGKLKHFDSDRVQKSRKLAKVSARISICPFFHFQRHVPVGCQGQCPQVDESVTLLDLTKIISGKRSMSDRKLFFSMNKVRAQARLELRIFFNPLRNDSGMRNISYMSSKSLKSAY